MARHLLCKIEDIPFGEGREFVAGGRVVAIFRVGDSEDQSERVLAVDGMCAHQGGPIAQGQLDQHCVTCPWHGWQYDIRDGKNLLTGKEMLNCFPAGIEDGQVWIDVDEA